MECLTLSTTDIFENVGGRGERERERKREKEKERKCVSQWLTNVVAQFSRVATEVKYFYSFDKYIWGA